MIVLRGGAETLELLLVQRTPKARFMGGVWVFPGGAVDAHEGEGDDVASRSRRSASSRRRRHLRRRRRTTLVKFSRWITPKQVAIRFDTHFFLAPLPDGQEPAIDGEECVDLGWFTPRAALDAHVARRARARLPDDQAPRAARRRSRRPTTCSPTRAGRDVAARRAARRDGGRGRARAAARRAGLRRRAAGMDAIRASIISTAR